MGGVLLTPSAPAHHAAPPSAWVTRWSHLVPAGAGVLDVACGGGRHLRWFAARGARVTGVDRDDAAFAALRADLGEAVELCRADIEAGPWPFPGRRFDAVVVANYLWRPLFPVIGGSVAEGGVLVWETFAAGNETVGRPSSPEFLLRPGELLDLAAAAGLRSVAFEDGFLPGPPPRFVQRIVAVREPAGAAPARHPLVAAPARPRHAPTLNSRVRKDPA